MKGGKHRNGQSMTSVYRYDPVAREMTCDYDGGNVRLLQAYDRSQTGRLETKTTDAGVWRYGYDLTDQGTNAVLSASASSDGAWGYSYDAMGNRKQASASSCNSTPDVTTYAANRLNQYSLISNHVNHVNPVKIRPSCDLNGNQKSAKPKAQPTGDRDFEAARMRGARSRIRRRSGNRHMTWDGTNAYFWDVQIKRAPSPRQGRRATAILRPSRSDGARSVNPRRSGNCYQLVLVSNAEIQVASAYDAMGRRVRKIISRKDAETQSWGVEKTCHFFYDGWNLVRETIGNQQSAITNCYIWGNDLSGSLQGAGGVGGLLAVLSYSTNSLQPNSLTTSYPLYDHNGNVERYVSRNGATVASFQYDAFGNIVSETLTNSGTNELSNFSFSFRFSTKYWDAEVGLYYYGYRFYRPGLGWWVNRDPIGEHENRGLYCCCNNNPIIRSDFLGLSVQMVPCKCNEKEINMYAYGLTKRAQYLSNQKPLKWYGETYYMEYCGIVCCDQETGVVSVKGPIEGDFRYQGRSDGAFNRDYYMKVPFYYKNGKRVDSVAKTCGDTVAGQLKCEGKFLLFVMFMFTLPILIILLAERVFLGATLLGNP